jgi:hypothetical protein
MRRLPIQLAVAALLLVTMGPVTAHTLVTGTLTQVSGVSPFAAGCGLEPTGMDPIFGEGVVFVGSEVEPFVDINPVNPANLIAVWQQDRWSNGGARGNAAGVSLNGGATWQIVTFPDVTVCTGGEFDRASDPWVSFGPDGIAYAMHLVTDGDTISGRPGGFGRNGMMVQTSTDGGLSWNDPVLIAEDTEGDDLHDKNSLTADPTRPGFAYAVWDLLDLPTGAAINPDRGVFGGGLGFKGAALISRTTDGGQTWSEPKTLYNPGGVNQTIGNQIVVQPDGALVDLFVEVLNFRNDDQDGQFDLNLSLKRSLDAGETWLPHGRPIRFAEMAFAPISDPDTGQSHRTADIIPDFAVDPDDGTLYAVWQDARFTGVSQVAFTTSSDGGFTWTTPIRISQTPADPANPLNAQAFIPAVHVADDGTVGVTYYDFRTNAGGGGTDTDLWLAHCDSGCGADPDNWEENHVAGPFDSRQAPISRGFFLGDYVGLTSDGEDFLSVATLTGGNGPTDEWFARIAPTP